MSEFVARSTGQSDTQTESPSRELQKLIEK
jgi:hypothetical protein